MPLLFAAGAVSIPLTWIAKRKMRQRKETLVAEMKSQGRTIDWPELVEALSESNGTLIAERYALKGPVNCWWTPEHVREKSPHPFADWLTMLKDDRFAPFSIWCRERYTSPETGSALILNPQSINQQEAAQLEAEHRGCESDNWIEVVPPDVLRRKKLKDSKNR